MEVKEKSYPYPLLCPYNDDFKNAEISFSCTVDDIQHPRYLDYVFSLDDEALIGYINDKKAVYIIHIECSKTFYREHFVVEQKGRLLLDIDKLEGTIQIVGFICSYTNIDKYYSKNFHDDYEDASFNIEKDSTLAVAGGYDFVIEKKYKQVGNPENIFALNINKDGKYLDINYDDNKIIINMPSSLNCLYQSYASANDDINCCLMLMPALLYIINEIKNKSPDEDMTNYKWYLSLREKCKKLDIDLDNFDGNSFQLAQKLLDAPYKSCFCQIKSLNEREE